MTFGDGKNPADDAELERQRAEGRARMDAAREVAEAAKAIEAQAAASKRGQRARARRGDPDTSHVAAASVGALNERQAAVWSLLGTIGPATHEQIIAAYRERPDLPAQTDQSIRSRCAEAVDFGWIVELDRAGRTVNDRPSIRWRAVRGSPDGDAVNSARESR